MEDRRQTFSSLNTQYFNKGYQQGSNLNRISSEPLFISHQRNYSQQDKVPLSNSGPKIRSTYRLNLDGVILSRQNQQYNQNTINQTRQQLTQQNKFEQLQHFSNEQNILRKNDLQLIEKGFYSEREMLRDNRRQQYPQVQQEFNKNFKIDEINNRQEVISESKHSSINSYSQPKKFKYVKKYQKNFNVDKKMKEIKYKKLNNPRHQKLKHLEHKAEQMEQLVEQLEKKFSSRSSDNVRDSYLVQNTYFPERSKVTKLFITKRNTVDSQDTFNPKKLERQTVLKVQEFPSNLNKEGLFKLEKKIKQLERKVESMQNIKTQNYKLKRDLLRKTAEREFHQDKQKELQAIINDLENKQKSEEIDISYNSELHKYIQEQETNEQNLIQRIENLNKKIYNKDLQAILQSTVDELKIIKNQQVQNFRLLEKQNQKLLSKNNQSQQKGQSILRKSQSHVSLSKSQRESFSKDYQQKIQSLKQKLKERDQKVQSLTEENKNMNKQIKANYEMIQDKQDFYDNVIRSNKKNIDNKEIHYQSFTKQQQKILEDLKDEKRDLKTKLEIEKLKNREQYEMERSLREKINRIQLQLEEKKILETSYQNQVNNLEKEIIFLQQNLKDQKRNHDDESLINREKYQELIRSMREQNQTKIDELEQNKQEYVNKQNQSQKEIQEYKSILKQEKQKGFKIQEELNNEIKQSQRKNQKLEDKNENQKLKIQDLKQKLNDLKQSHENEIQRIKNQYDQSLHHMQQKFLEEKNKSEQIKLKEQEQLVFSKFQIKKQLEQEFDQNIVQMESQYERLKKDYLSALKENENLSEEKQYLLDSMQKSTENLKVLRENLKETEIQFDELKKIFYANQETQDQFLNKKESLENENMKLIMVCKEQENEIQNKQDQLDKLLIHSFQLTIFGKFLTKKIERQQ